MILLAKVYNFIIYFFSCCINNYVFNFDNKNFDHIPGELNGSHKEINDDLAKELRTLLLKNLNR